MRSPIRPLGGLKWRQVSVRLTAPFFDQIVEAAISDFTLRQAAAVNPGDKFELVFKNLLEALFVERMDQNEELFGRFMNDQAFQQVVTGWLSSEAYKKLRSIE